MTSGQEPPAPSSRASSTRPASPAGVAEARRLFPRGLFQPAGSFRFSLASLLPVAFAQIQKVDDNLIDLGAGCGVIGLAALLRRPELRLTAVEREPALCEAIQRNADLLGLMERVRILETDLGLPLAEGLRARADLVLANPPYRRRGHGRLPPSPLRARALFDDGPRTLRDFCRAAAFCLRPEGRFVLVYPAERQLDLRTALEGAGLGLCRLRPVRSYADAPDTLVLAEAQQNAPLAPEVEPALVLHQITAGRTTLSSRALEFCPELACNGGTGA